MGIIHFKHWMHELRHWHVRRVFRAVATYGIVAFALVELTEPVAHALHLPEWTLSLVVVLLGLGFPVVAVFAWILSDFADHHSTAGERAADVEPLPGPGDGAVGRRRRIPFRVAMLLVGVGLLVAAPGLVYYFALRHRAASEGGGAAAARTIAVLPFADLSPGKDQEYFADRGSRKRSSTRSSTSTDFASPADRRRSTSRARPPRSPRSDAS